MRSDAEWSVGQQVDSIYGLEHRGFIVEIGAFADGRPMIHVRRDSDGFVWVGWPGTVLPSPVLN